MINDTTRQKKGFLALQTYFFSRCWSSWIKHCDTTDKKNTSTLCVYNVRHTNNHKTQSSSILKDLIQWQKHKKKGFRLCRLFFSRCWSLWIKNCDTTEKKNTWILCI